MMRKSFLSAIAITFALAVVLMPGLSQATNTSSGSAYINWSLFSFSITEGTGGTGASVTPDWTASGLYGPGVETRGSFSAAGTGLNSPADPYEAVDFNDGLIPPPATTPWTNTYAPSTKSLGPNSVAGSADTYTPPTLFDPATAFDANEIFASLFLALFGSNMSGDIFAQGVLSGQFTVPVESFLNVTVPYELALQMDSIGGSEFNFAEVTAALVLSDFNTTDPITGQSLVLTQDVQSLSGLLTHTDSYHPPAANGNLLIVDYPLHAFNTSGPIYDFEVSATATASAVPEPATLILLLSGMMGLAAFRKRFL